MMPVYYVIAEQRMYQNMFTIDNILGIFECDIEDINALYNKHAAPLSYTGMRITTHIYARVPNSQLFNTPPSTPQVQLINPVFEKPAATKDDTPEDNFWERAWKSDGGAEDL